MKSSKFSQAHSTSADDIPICPTAVPRTIAEANGCVAESPSVFPGKVAADCIRDPGEGLVAFHAAKDAVAWMADRFAGKPAPDECVNPR